MDGWSITYHSKRAYDNKFSDLILETAYNFHCKPIIRGTFFLKHKWVTLSLPYGKTHAMYLVFVQFVIWYCQI